MQVVPHLVDRRLEGVDIHRLGELRPVHGHGLVERHDLCHLSFVCHQAPELVAADPQLQGICSDDLLRDDGRSTESPRNLGALLESSREAVAVESLQGSAALGANAHVLGAVAGCLIGRDAPAAHLGHGRVHAATEALVRGHAEVDRGARPVHARQARKEVLHGPDEGQRDMHAALIFLQLRGCDHLHGLRDLLHVVEGAHSGLQGLQRGSMPRLLRIHAASDRALEGRVAEQAHGEHGCDVAVRSIARAEGLP
mmetsp:Transcript_57173/g.149753  ORF Transcript_57173/g.149753 Transcript_57173/m.149753 type:complete len:254 (-) Transcript_57173:43-804(-)